MTIKQTTNKATSPASCDFKFIHTKTKIAIAFKKNSFCFEYRHKHVAVLNQLMLVLFDINWVLTQ